MIQKPAEPRYPSVNLITQKSRRQRVNAAPRWTVVIFAAVALVAWVAAAVAVAVLLGWNPTAGLLK